ncbi:T9SS type A sorting domain-containing protein [Ekhidna sp.]
MKITELKNLILLILLFEGSVSLAQQPQWFIKNQTELGSKIVDLRPNLGPVLQAPPSLLMPPSNSWLYSFKEADNAIYDENGDLEIYIAHDEVFDASGNNIFTLVDQSYSPFYELDYDHLHDQDLAIARVPYDCSKYYIFRYAWENQAVKIHYWIYDISLNTFLVDTNGTLYPNGVNWIPGNQVYSNVSNNNGENSVRNISISKINNSGERLVLFEDDEWVHKITLSQSGITYDGQFFQKSGSGGDYLHEAEVVKLIDGSYRYATMSQESNVSFGELLSIDNAGNLVSNSIFTTNGLIKGVEFSIDGNYLYFTKNVYPYLQYVDVSTSSVINSLAPSFLNAGEANTFAQQRSSFESASIEVAHDGKMYFAGGIGMSSLADSNDPNSLWINLDMPLIVDEYSVGISEKFRPLPSQVDGELLYTPITLPSVVTACGNNFPQVCVEDYPGFTYYWSLSGSQLSQGFGSCFNPNQYGQYNLKVTDENLCEKWYSIEVQNDLPNIPPIKYYSYCSLKGKYPAFVGWGSNPMLGYQGFYGIEWTYEGNPISSGGSDYQIPNQGDGTYTATVHTICGSQTFTFTVYDQLSNYSSHPFALSQFDGFYSLPPSNANYARFKRVGTNPWINDHFWTISDGTTTVNSVDQLIYFPYTPGSGVVLTLTLKLTDHENCTIYTNTTTWSDPPGDIIDDSEIAVVVTPNPTDGNTSVLIENFDSDKNYTLEVTRLDGRSFLKQEISSERTALDLSRFEQGMYLVKVSNETWASTVRVIKE